MTTGFPLAMSVKSEIIPINTGEAFCTDFPDSPIQNQNAVGAFLGNEAVICGGDGGKEDCYFLGSNGLQVFLGIERISSGAAYFDNILAIIGGSPLGSPASNTFEGCDPTTGTCNLGNLTFNIKDHCVVSFDDKPLIIGGLTGESDTKAQLSDKVYVFNRTEFGFDETSAKLIDARSNLACAAMDTLDFDGNPTSIVVVVGGIGEDNKNVKYVEIMMRNQPFFFRGTVMNSVS